MIKKLNWNLFSKFRNELFGLSVIGIIILHYFEDVLSADCISGITSKIALAYSSLIGSTGVDIFLFLSGMGLFYSLKKKFDIISFYKSRLKRLLIPFLILAVVYWLYIDLIYSSEGFVRFLLDLSLITFWTEGDTHFWYVALIIICYLLYPFFFKLFCGEKKKTDLAFFIISLAYAAALFAVALAFPEFYENTEIALTRFWVFIFGSWAGSYIYNKREIKLPWLMAAGIAARMAVLGAKLLGDRFSSAFDIAYPLNRWILSWHGMSIMLICTIILETFSLSAIKKFLTAAGSYSLELYIVHVSVRTIMNRNGLYTYYLHYYLIMIAVSVIVSILLKAVSNKVQKLIG